MLDKNKVKQFWDNRSKYYNKMAFESIVNLEQHPGNLAIKIHDEKKKVMAWLPDLKDKTILDLGSGIGQWSFRFIEQGAQYVQAVEFSESLAEIGRNEALRRNVNNLEYVVSPAEAYQSDKIYDIIFISGLMVYLNDEQAEKLLANLVSFSSSETKILLREGTGIKERYEINNQFSEHLQDYYSATYRTAGQYKKLFNRYGFSLIKEENMFPEGHILNKYPQTRLRLYLMAKNDG